MRKKTIRITEEEYNMLTRAYKTHVGAQKQYYERNKEYFKEYHRKWQQENKEKLRQYQKAWRDAKKNIDNKTNDGIVNNTQGGN